MVWQEQLEEEIRNARDQNSKLWLQVNKSSVQAVDEAYKKQKEAEKQLQSLKYHAEQNRKIAETEVRKLKKRIKLQSEKIKEIKFFCGIGYIVALVLSACLIKMYFSVYYLPLRCAFCDFKCDISELNYYF